MNAGDGMIASIGLFGGDFAPRSYALCQGQLLPINQNTALFSILGTIYGGDGRTTFALPDLRGRVAMGHGNGPGLTPTRLGVRGGGERNTLTLGQLPSHSHTIAPSTYSMTLGANGTETTGGGNFLTKKVAASSGTPNDIFGTTATGQTLNAGAITGGPSVTSLTGASQSVNNMQPYLVLNYIIALTGIFPSRN